MASNRNVIKATKSPMSLATSYMTNMTRCVIRPTYNGGRSYLPWLQGEHRPSTQTERKRSRDVEAWKNEEREICAS